MSATKLSMYKQIVPGVRIRAKTLLTTYVRKTGDTGVDESSTESELLTVINLITYQKLI